tara:strand:- start:39040 stop:42003 length:2964 start_codon:yes stop_codon:yes gene_type:complete
VNSKTLQKFRYQIWIYIAAGLLTCGGVVYWLSGESTDPRELLQRGNRELAAGHAAKAQVLADQIIARDPKQLNAILLAARAAQALGDRAGVLAYYESLPETSSPSEVDSLCSGADLAMQWGQISAAERLYRRCLTALPQHLRANTGLAYLLGVEGRCAEAVEPLLRLVQQRQFGLHHLVLLGASHPVIADNRFIERCRTANPTDPLPLIGLARTSISQNEFEPAREWLEEVVRREPHSAEGQAQLGQVLQLMNSEAFRKWNRDLPADVEGHAGVWVAQGLWFRAHNNLQAATRCLWEAVRRDPDHRIANLQLGQTLVALGSDYEAQPFLNRGKQLLELAQVVDDLYAHPQNTAGMQRAVEITEELGRLWEAWAWSMLAVTQNREAAWPRTVIERLQPRLSVNTPRTLVSANPATHIDLTKYSLPQKEGTVVAETEDRSLPDLPLRFRDEAVSRGIDFVYRSRGADEPGELRMYESNGGGVAVLDYDGDGYPDLYLTQGGTLSPETQSAGMIDHCFRNLGTGSFADVTTKTGLGSASYGQGVTVGDFNNDGFPDLYVANLGQNQLYENLGDGTFQKVLHTTADSSAQWTTSCLVADLNGDGLPDLYDVNYLSLEDARRATCRKGEELQWCNPSSFAASQDRLYLNSGNGSFVEISEQAGIVVPEGKGLGIVAADFNGSGQLSLFVANDAVANFFFQNDSKTSATVPRFTETATSLGLAFDTNGFPQACMGVAAGDVNGDSRLDLFVTNFYAQSNTLYLNQEGGVFVDATGRSGLREPGYHRLGFGTQCLDAELDGWLDLVVANGHVLDLSAGGTPYQMAPQYFRNVGQGTFKEVAAGKLGDYFEQAYLGRGLARLDWNRDGRPDFVVSNINAPASLVTNLTVTPNHYLAIQLCGVTSSRDAIGAVVTVRTSQRVQVQQLTAGDGFQATNQRQLLFGLGDETTILELNVRWPSGKHSTYLNVPVDRELKLIEGKEASSIQERDTEAKPT